MTLVALVASLLACGSDPAPPPAPPPPKAIVAAPPPPAPKPPTLAPTGPYTPDALAKAAYDLANAAGAAATANPKSGDVAAIAAGKSLWGKCTSCHGESGGGDGIVGGALPQRPAQFNWPERWAATTVGVKHWIIKNGVAGTAMAPLGLTDDQAWEVLAFIESDLTKK